ncbi:hypothetical protein Tco_1555549 [Tanacetum coccineum]
MDESRPIVNTDTQPEVVTPVKPDDISLPIRRTSGRVNKPPQFYYGFYIEEDKISDSTLCEWDEPANYKEAIKIPKAAKWKEAMKSKIQSMYDNKVWNLVDTTPGLKTVGCKWIFKKKTNMDGKVHTYKARIMLAIAAFHDYEIWQMDVKTAFLKLTEDVLLVAGICASMRKSCILYFQEAKMRNDIPTLQSVKDWLGKCFAMKDLGDASYILGSIMYAMTCTRPDVSFALSMVSRHQQNLGEGHWTTVKNILKYLRNTKDSSKQDKVADSTCESEYIVACKASKEAIWMKNFIRYLRVVPIVQDPIKIFCDNESAVALTKEPKDYGKSKHIERKYHFIQSKVVEGHVTVKHIRSEDNLTDPFIKALAKSRHD